MTDKATPSPELLTISKNASQEDIERAHHLAREWLTAEEAFFSADIRHTVAIFECFVNIMGDEYNCFINFPM